MSAHKTQLRSTAYHEAGHAVAAEKLEVLYVGLSIVPSEGRAGGVGVEGDDGYSITPGTDPYSPENEKAFRKWAEQQAVIDYAGHAAVVALLGIGSMSEASATSEGAGDDFEKARERLGGDQRRIKRAQTRALQIVKAQRDDVRKVAEALSERQRLSSQQVEWIIYHGLPIPDWLS